MADECIFCDIVAGKLPSEAVYKDDLVYAFRDINPVAPTHILVIPQKHIGALTSTTQAEDALLGHLLTTAAQIAKEQGISTHGYRLSINQGDDAGQIVAHLHLHILGGKKLSQMG